MPAVFAFSCTVGFSRDGARFCFSPRGRRSKNLGLALAKSYFLQMRGKTRSEILRDKITRFEK
jgi:hypothetical protein